MKYVDAKELAIAEDEAAAADDNITIEFKKPVLYNGNTYTSLTFNFESLTGADGLEIENELMAMGRVAIVPAVSGEYLVRMAARACTEQIGSDIFQSMSLHDYNSVRSAARSFLMKSE